MTGARGWETYGKLKRMIVSVCFFYDCYDARKKRALTRNNIAGVHSILVLDETKTVHELDFGDLAGSVSCKMGFHIGLGCFAGVSIVYRRMGVGQTRRQSRDKWTEQVASQRQGGD